MILKFSHERFAEFLHILSRAHGVIDMNIFVLEEEITVVLSEANYELYCYLLQLEGRTEVEQNFGDFIPWSDWGK